MNCIAKVQRRRKKNTKRLLRIIEIISEDIDADNNITSSHLPPLISSTYHNLNPEHSPEYIIQQYLFCLTDVGLNFFSFLHPLLRKSWRGSWANTLKTSDIMIIHENMFYHLEVQWKMHDGINGSHNPSKNHRSFHDNGKRTKAGLPYKASSSYTHSLTRY